MQQDDCFKIIDVRVVNLILSAVVEPKDNIKKLLNHLFTLKKVGTIELTS
tara:strand:- start:1479 stop:1628 length:150 start_codon:yes stop_codon:yes gene_type:complete